VEALVSRLEPLASGTGGVVLIEGVAGIGKSSLLRAFVGAALERPGLRVLTARGTELELELAFGAVRRLFAPVVTMDEPERGRVLSGPASLAAAVLGLRELRLDPLADPLYALSWLATHLAELAPVVIAIDDVHWLDAESGRFVAYLASAWRPTGAARRHRAPARARAMASRWTRCGRSRRSSRRGR
jgi:predicted ATPase